MEPMGRGNSERLDQASCALAINFNRHHGRLRHRCLCGLVGVHALAASNSSATAMTTAATKISA